MHLESVGALQQQQKKKSQESSHIGGSGGGFLPDQMADMNSWICSTSHLEVLSEEQHMPSRVPLENRAGRESSQGQALAKLGPVSP